jgi:glycine/D-amino acid oxidase-like deaminating enzyme
MLETIDDTAGAARPVTTIAALATCSRWQRRPVQFSQAPYWWEGLRNDYPDPGMPAATDVVIVGSGFTGLSAALTLLRHGRSVVVFDAGRPGFGASTRNGGQVGSGNQKFRVKTLIALRGEKKAVALLNEGVAMLAYIEQLIAAERISCNFSRCGRFRGAVRPEHYEAMARDMDDLRKYAGVESFSVPRAEQHREIATDVFHGGSVLPNDAGLHPGLYHQGLLDCVTGNGGIVRANSPVTAIDGTGAGFLVVTPGGRIRARNVLVASNGYTGHLEGYLKRRVVTVESALLATAPLPRQRISALMPGGRMYGNTARVFSYFRASPDGTRIIWGGRVGRLHGQHSAAAYSHLARDLLAVFPSLSDAPVSHVWSGRIGYTFDELPHLGKTPSGIHFAMGYCGTGVSRATYFGHKIALQLLGDPSGRTAFDDIEFPSHAFHAVAHLGVPLVETWYRLRDALNF